MWQATDYNLGVTSAWILLALFLYIIVAMALMLLIGATVVDWFLVQPRNRDDQA
jgi:hypothetical protein